MTWDSAIPIMVRSAIGDFDSPPLYSDDKLLTVILTATQVVLFNITPSQTYAIDVENLTLTPDPLDPIVNDTSFTYLVTLKASAMLLRAEVRRYGQQAIAIRDGTSAIDLKRDLKALTELANTYETELTKAVIFYQQNTGGLAGKIIVSPYRGLLSCLDGYFPRSRSYRY